MKMMNTAAFAIFIGCAFIAPAAAINCLTCNNCSIPGGYIENTTCSPSEDSCLKIDFGNNFIYKQCAVMSSMCNSSGYKYNLPTSYSQAKSLFGQVAVDAELMANLNSRGRHVISCCQNTNHCNSGMQVTMSFLAALGMSMVHFIMSKQHS